MLCQVTGRHKNWSISLLYVRDGNSGHDVEGPKLELNPGEWVKLDFDIPRMDGACLIELGSSSFLQAARMLW